MSSGGAAGVVTMKTSTPFSQSNSQLPKHHSQSTLQPTNVFDQQIHHQHMIQQQLQHNQNQSSQLHRLSQPHISSSIHPTHSVSQSIPANHNHSSVFPNAEFFQTLQQTAAAALPTVLPYDQSQYIGQLMYFPYPTAAAAAANGLFSAAASDAHHMSVCSGAPGTQTAVVNQTSCNATHLLGTAGLVSATPSGMVALNTTGNSNQVHNAGQLFAPGTGIVGLGSSTGSVTNTLASASLAPLFTTAHFYPQHQQPVQQQLQISHQLQQHQQQHTSMSLQHMQSLPSYAGIHLQQQQQPQSTILLSNPTSSVPQLTMVSQSDHMTPHSTSQSIMNNDCETLSKVDDKIQSTPIHTPQKQGEQDLMSHSTQLGTPSQGNNSSLDASSATVKRDNNGTGHFVCGVCGREFGMRCRLIAHTRRHTGERPFPCADCGRAFSDRGNLQRHRYTHSSQPRFHCNVCRKSFRQASCLSNHRRFHCAGATGRPCPFCQRSFRSSSSLQMHIRWKHRADAAAAVAAAAAAAAASGTSSLSEAFNHLPGLSSYVSSGTVNGIPTMSLNGSAFGLQGSSLLSAAAAVAASAAIVNNSNVHNLMAPIALNSTSTPIMSGVLDSVLNTSINLGSPNKRKWRRKSKPKQTQNMFGKLSGEGMSILAGINLAEGIDVNAAAAAAGAAAAAVGGPVPLDRKGRPCNYPCPACPRRFAFQCRLAAHLRCHTNIRPFICIDCGRAFTQRGYLVRHAAVHKLDRPFSCGLCDRSYKHYGSLVNHRRTHSKGGMSTLGLLNSTNIGTLSSLEEVVSGALCQTHKTDASDSNNNNNGNNNSNTNATTTITLLPVSKVEEILPGDIGNSVQQMCLSSVACSRNSNILSVSEAQDQLNRNNNHHESHQLTATAVWPVLATGSINQIPSAQLISTVPQSRQTMVSGVHFPTIAISSAQISQNNQLTSHQLAPVTSRTQSNVIPTMISATGTPGASTFITVPLFSGQSQTLSDRDNNSVNGQINAHPHHQFHCSTTVITPNSLSESSQQQHHHQQLTSLQHNSQQNNSGIIGTDANSAPVLHVLQPSPSIFFSPYYLPHSAASQMQ